MSRFYGSLTGQAKSTATRQGSTNSGVSAHVRGWDIGIGSEVSECPQCNEGILLQAWITGGSNNPVMTGAEPMILVCTNGCWNK